MSSPARDSEMRMHLAHLAAVGGDRELMHTIFSMAVRDIDEMDDGPDTRTFFAVALAARWAHAIELSGVTPEEQRERDPELAE